MKNAILLILLTSLSIKQSTDYSGTWVNSGDKFENKLTLEKIEGDLNTYKFSFDGWRKSYDSFTDQEVKFLGGMNDEVFIIELDENQAVYSDDLREFKGLELIQ